MPAPGLGLAPEPSLAIAPSADEHAAPLVPAVPSVADILAHVTRAAVSSLLSIGALSIDDALADAMASAGFAAPPRRWTLDASHFKRRRARMSAALKATLVSQEDVENYRRDKAASWLSECLPQSLADELLAGASGVAWAVAQVPDPAERRAALKQKFLLKAGPDGSGLGKARRALEELVDYHPSDHLPASALLCNRLIDHVGARARAAGKGSQDGESVGPLIRTGLCTLELIGFPVEASNLTVKAAAPPAKKRRRERRSGSLPLAAYCHLETLASGPADTPQRFYARSLVICWAFGRLRMVDVMRARIVAAGYDADGCLVIMIITSFSKDGAPIDVYLRAEGFLGRWAWASSHLESLKDAQYVLPAFDAPGRAGDVRFATKMLPRVAPKDHAIRSLKSITVIAPLGLDWGATGVGPHSGHGSCSDIAAYIPEHTHPAISLSPADEQELGHWRRRAANARDGELPLATALQEAVDHHSRQHARAGEQQPAAAAAAPAIGADDAAMRVRYTSGTNREGRRRAQLRVHARLVLAVRTALAIFGQPWTSLPKGRADYGILDALEGLTELVSLEP